jgi:hypothetical protein
MSVFSQWCRNAHRRLSTHRAKLSLGQVYEITAAGLGHDTYASFKLQDLPRLNEAAYALISAEAMVRRAAALGITLDAHLCHDAVRDFHIRPSEDEWVRDVVVGEDMDWAIRRTLQDTNHPEGIELALEINATFDGITMYLGEPEVPFDQTGKSWLWRVTGTAHSSKGQEYFDLDVQADALFSRVGRRLLSQCVVLNVRGNGVWEKENYDPTAAGRGEGYLLSDSDL